ncbi:MAG: hypothetical protein A3C47_05935 [Omnitrophica bacterium RIFCSPHIGHO2_02_FULL_51_18]|nr:MAG: hypothetical protein A3C47_05935 [Omnitrophica bacterium RIFCSPHIGHO2_02_FULL_51_18]
MIGLRVQGSEISLGLIIGRAAGINYILFFTWFFVGCYHERSFFHNNPYNKKAYKSSDINSFYGFRGIM